LDEREGKSNEDGREGKSNEDEPTTLAEVLKQPIFFKPLVTNAIGNPLGVSRFNKG
jgi:hypothetical protein